MPKRRFIKAKRFSPFSFQTKWKCNARSLKTFTLHESGTLKNCGYITKALTQRWESFLKREMQKRSGAYCFLRNIY